MRLVWPNWASSSSRPRKRNNSLRDANLLRRNMTNWWELMIRWGSSQRKTKDWPRKTKQWGLKANNWENNLGRLGVSSAERNKEWKIWRNNCMLSLWKDRSWGLRCKTKRKWERNEKKNWPKQEKNWINWEPESKNRAKILSMWGRTDRLLIQLPWRYRNFAKRERKKYKGSSFNFDYASFSSISIQNTKKPSPRHLYKIAMFSQWICIRSLGIDIVDEGLSTNGLTNLLMAAL